MIFKSLTKVLAGAVLAVGLATGANAAVFVGCGDATGIASGDLFLGAVVSGGGSGSCAIDFTSSEDPLGASAAATISVGNLAQWSDLTVSWLSGATVLASASVAAPEIVLATVFTVPNLVQTLVFEWSNVILPTGADVIGFDFEVAAVPLPPALLLFGSAMAGIGFLSRKRKKNEPSLV